AAVNYLEAVLPSLVSKAVFAHGKGTALGIYATCQFLGAFVGGGLGGFLLQENGVNGLLVLVVGAAVLWLMLLPGLAEPRLEAQRAL
ncbi:MAG: MFS transporter, partial [Pseudomonadota bacterium]